MKRRKIAVLVCGLIFIPSLCMGETALDSAIKKQGMVTSEAVESQARINTLNDDSIVLRQEIANKKRELENLQVYNRYLQNSLDKQKTLIQDKQQQLESITVLQREMIPLMIKMLDTLELFVKQDKPFLREERLGRISDVRSDLHRTDKTLAEKYRRVLELYQKESESGRTLSVFDSEIAINGKKQLVELLKVGRVGLFYRTLDHSHYGHWNSAKGSWESLSDDYYFELNKAYKVAAKRSAPELLNLPLVKYVRESK